MFQGSITALVTPMHADGSIAISHLKALVEWHIQSKTDALVIAGTTGESATLEIGEYFTLLSTASKQAKGRIPIIAGCGTNSTHTTLLLMKQAEQAGADAYLIVTPYYNKPTQQGLYQHYRTLAQQSARPIILYNVPSRTGCDLLPETIERLAQINSIIGVKESTGCLNRAQDIMQRCPLEFAVYSGDDHTGLTLLLHGAKGIISVTANITPEKMHSLCAAVQSKQFSIASAINAKLDLLHQRLFLESNPIPVKWALYMLNKIPPGIRLPLTPLNNQYHQTILEALNFAGIRSI